MVLDHVASLLSPFPSNKWPSGCLLCPCCAHRRVGEGAGEGGSSHGGVGELSPPLVAPRFCSPCPVLGCRSCTSIMAHINRGSFAKLPRDSAPHLLRAGFGLLPDCQVYAPAGPGTSQDLTTKPFSGRLWASTVATWEFTYSWVVCAT